MVSPAALTLGTSALLVAMAGHARADVIVVSPSESIQSAIDAAEDDDVIELEAGDFVLPVGVSLETRFRQVLIRGTRGPDGEWLSRIVSTDASAIEHHGGNGRTLEIEDVAFSGAIGTDVGGSSTAVAISLISGYGQVRRCLFEECLAPTQDGGAISVSGGSFTHRMSLEDCTFRRCHGRLGGAIYHRMASSQTSAARWPVVRCRFEDNLASDIAGGGAIYALNYGAGVVDSVFVENLAADPGPPLARAIMSFQANPATIEGSSFCSVLADAAGLVHVSPTSSVGSTFNCLANSCADVDGDDRPDACDQCDGPDVDADGSGWADCHERVDELGRRVLTVAAGTPIQSAIDAAEDDDVIELEAGDFVLPVGVSLETRFRQVLIRGTRGPDGEWLSRVVSTDATAIEHNGGNGNTLELEDLTFTGTIGSDVQGSTTPVAIQLTNGGYGLVRSCLFEYCVAPTQDGGAVWVNGGSPAHRIDFEDCTFRECEGRLAGAIYHRHVGGAFPNARWNVDGCYFERNRAIDVDGAGAIFAYRLGVDIEGGSFVRNIVDVAPLSAIAVATQGVSSDVSTAAFCASFADPVLGSFVTGGVIDGGGVCVTADCTDVDDNGVPDICDPVLCPGDINGDEMVDAADLGLLVGAWGDSDSDADLNGDGGVDAADLGLLIGGWGLCG